eukprot:scaffold9990_cov43-Cyclotella_meneghiniana.AAC.5
MFGSIWSSVLLCVETFYVWYTSITRTFWSICVVSCGSCVGGTVMMGRAVQARWRRRYGVRCAGTRDKSCGVGVVAGAWQLRAGGGVWVVGR